MNIESSFNSQENAWVTPEVTLDNDTFLVIELKQAGKIVIRQRDQSGEHPRIPISPHKNTDKFELRLLLKGTNEARIQIFTSVEPKNITYDYISRRRKSGKESAPDENG